MEYDNSNRGAIWKNDKKETEKHPDFTGEAKITAPGDYWVSAWKRKPGASDKSPALSFAFTPKNAQAPKPKSEEMFPSNVTEDDLPF